MLPQTNIREDNKGFQKQKMIICQSHDISLYTGDFQIVLQMLLFLLLDDQR